MSATSQDLAHTKMLQIPTVDHTRIYSPTEKLDLALSHYHAELQQYQHDPISNKRPIVLRIARAYQVSEATLRRRIKNPMQTAQLAAQGHSNQALTGAEEKALVDRLQFLDDCNIPADRETVYSLAHSLLHRREPDRQLGYCWLGRFLERHPEMKYVYVKTISTSRANAESWDIMDDFFWKVSEVLAINIYLS